MAFLRVTLTYTDGELELWSRMLDGHESLVSSNYRGRMSSFDAGGSSFSKSIEVGDYFRVRAVIIKL